MSLFIIGASILGLFYFSDNYYHILICVGFLSVGMSISSCLQIPLIPIILAQECEKFGKGNVIAYIRTTERIGFVISGFVIAFFYKVFQSKIILILGYSNFFILFFTVLFLIKLKFQNHSETSNI